MAYEQTDNVSQQLEQLSAAYWDFYLDEHPVTARSCGVQGNSGVFFKESIADHDRRKECLAAFRNQAAQLAPASLNKAESISLKLLVRELDEAIQSHQMCEHLRPLWFPFGPDMDLAFAMQFESLDGEDAVDSYINRLGSVPGYFRDCLERIEMGVRQGFRVPEVLRHRILKNVRSHLKEPGDCNASWYAPLDRNSQVGPHFLETKKKQIRKLAETEILPAWNQFAEALDAIFVANSRESISCLDDPDGAAHYDFLVKHHTTLDTSPEEIHAIGLFEVTRISVEMSKLAADSKEHRTVDAMRDFLQTDPQFFCGSKYELLGKIERLSKQIDRRIPEFFSVIPRMTYGVECIPEESAPQMPPAYAQPNPGDRTQAGIHWITSLPERCPSHMHIPLALHEAWPGHLMHIALLQENQALPDFRRFSHMNYTSLLEGWALYCERLGIELGLYTDEYLQFGRLEMEMWRSVRLVVDTGIHVKSWSRKKAIGYMRQHTSLVQSVIEAEIDRYIGMPGQALAYKLGEIEIVGLRCKAEETLGTSFSLREFHDCLLTAGAVTLPLLEEIVSDWLTTKKDESKKL